MTIKEAYQILGIPVGTDFYEIKKRYRQLMLQVHPDSCEPFVSREPSMSCEPSMSRAPSVSCAQEITAAYSVLKRSISGSSTSVLQKGRETARNDRKTGPEEKRYNWNAPVNEHAYREREIYHYAEDSEGTILGSFCIARGKYLWTTEEDFSLFLLSIARCGNELLDELDHKPDSQRDAASFSHGRQRSQILAELVYLLAQQFIDGTSLLRELSGRETRDKSGNPVFYLPAMLELAPLSPVPEAGGVLCPSRLQNHRLYLKNQSGLELGYLSFPDDRLYYVVIPLFEQRKAQVRIQLAETESGETGTGKTQRRQKKDTGGYRRLHLWIKLPSDRGNGMPENLNLQIEQLLDRCRQSL